MVVYLDLVVLLNFMVDFLLLLGANRLLGYPPGLRRAAIAAALGGLYGGACLLPGMSFLGSSLWRLIFLVLMALLAYGMQLAALRRGAVFVLLSMALGGAAMGTRSGGFGLILGAGAIALLCRVAFHGGAPSQEYVEMTLQYGGQRRKITALRDTGNSLRDPITGEHVLVVDADVAAQMLGLEGSDLLDPIRTMERCPVSGLRLIPYRAVGQPGGMLLAVRMEVTARNGKRSMVVAFAPQKMGGFGGHEALAGGAV